MKAFVTTLMLLVSSMAFGDEAFLKAGVYLDSQTWHTDTQAQKDFIDESYDIGQLFYIQIEYKSEFFNDIFFISGNIKTYMVSQKEMMTYNPVYLDYGCSVGFQYNGIEFGISHLCTHPQNTDEGILPPMLAEQSTYTELYIQFKSKFPGHF